MSFKDIALPLIEKGIPVFPLLPRQKEPAISAWPQKATTDRAQIEAWDAENPDYNCGCCALPKLDGVWFLEFDSPEARQRLLDETGREFPRTFAVRSSPGRGHFYFKQSAASIAMGNIAQGFVKCADWSARVDREYVVSPGSIHPRTGEPYETRCEVELIEAPQWLIVWLLSQKVQKPSSAIDDSQDVPDGQRDSFLTHVAGKLRNAGLDRDQIFTALSEVNERRCKPPKTRADVERISGSVARYPKGKDTTVLFNGRVGGSNDSPSVQVEDEVLTPLSQPITALEHPEFPRWIMARTSIKNNLVDPVCAVNTRYPEYMFMPAVVLMLNYLSGKIKVEGKGYPLSIYMASIGAAGKVIKSSCIQDAITYMEHVGIVANGNREANPSTVAGKTLVWSPGSIEGLGLDMKATGNQNGVLFYDEIDTLVKKGSIDSSTLVTKLVEAYEGRGLRNSIKDTKKSYDIQNLCLSALMCSTDEKFAGDWARLCGGESGLNTRFFFLFQPKTLHDLKPMTAVSTAQNSHETRRLIDKAIAQETYKFDDIVKLQKFMKESNNDNRCEIRAEKFALYFAIDLGLDEIDDECVERGLALARYERQVKKFLRVKDALTKEGALQQKILGKLRQHGGVVTVRELERTLHPESYGTTMWMGAIKGLQAIGWVSNVGQGVKNSPNSLFLTPNAPDFTDDED